MKIPAVKLIGLTFRIPLLITLSFCFSSAARAVPMYWNVFNIEGESSVAADIVTYDNLTDMLTNSNRTSTNTIGGFGRNIVGSGSDGSTFWNVFNIEGESSVAADIVTYDNLIDMLTNSNRTSTNTIGSFGRNIVGSGSDGSTFWNVFNIEGESSVAADIVTYDNLTDMLTNSNRTSTNTIDGFGRNIVGSGSDGSTYWNVFNIEGESSVAADIVTYANLTDMLTNSNRTSTNTIGGFGRNIVGSGAFMLIDEPNPAPVPTTLALFALGLAGIGWSRSKKA